MYFVNKIFADCHYISHTPYSARHMIRCAHAIFVNNIFANWDRSTKFAKIFSREINPLYGKFSCDTRERLNSHVTPERLNSHVTQNTQQTSTHWYFFLFYDCPLGKEVREFICWDLHFWQFLPDGTAGSCQRGKVLAFPVELL